MRIARPSPRRCGVTPAMSLLDRCQPLAPRAAAVSQDGAPTLARVAIEKSVLPFAADFRRLILSLHKFVLRSPGDGSRSGMANHPAPDGTREITSEGGSVKPARCEISARGHPKSSRQFQGFGFRIIHRSQYYRETNAKIAASFRKRGALIEALLRRGLQWSCGTN